MAPSAPGSVTPRRGNHQIVLSWTPSPAATSYTVLRSGNSGGPYTRVADVTGTTYVDAGLTNTRTYFYSITASNAFGTSDGSAEIAAVPGIWPKILATGGSHTLAFLEDSTLWSFGDNEFGQLGPGAGSILQSNVAVPAADFDDVAGLSVGDYFSLALRADGSVWAWGRNDSGQLGVDAVSVPSRSTPAPVPGLSSVVAVSAGTTHALALRSDGSVWSWGANDQGQLGRGGVGAGAYPTPTPVPNLSAVVALAAGSTHSLALCSDGSVWGWGSNGNGEIANVRAAATPGQILNASRIVSIAAGNSTSFAIDIYGTVWAWGFNFQNQLGVTSSSSNSVLTPTPTSDSRPVLAVGAGQFATAFLHADGSVSVWGMNIYAQYADGTMSTGSLSGISAVPGLSDVAALTVRQGAFFAIKKDGSLWAWGRGTFGELGSGIGNAQPVPVQVSGITNLVAFSCGLDHGLVALADSSCWAWGDNTFGQLGTGTGQNSSVRTPVMRQGVPAFPVGGIVAVAAGGDFSLALVTGGTVLSWGENDDGELCIGNYTPASMAGGASGLSGVTKIFAGEDTAFAVLSDGTVHAWGYNNGVFGNGGFAGSTTAVPVPGLSNVVKIAVGGEHALALLTDGSVWSWGTNTWGELGINSLSPSLVPVKVSSLSGVVDISVGDRHSLVVKGDGTVWACGQNDFKQLADPTIPLSMVPIQVSSLSGCVAVAAGFQHSVALRNDGSVWCWGDNSFGQLASATVKQSAVPLEAPGIASGKDIWAGAGQTFVHLTDGSLWGWGANGSGELGIGSDGYVRSVIQVTH